MTQLGEDTGVGPGRGREVRKTKKILVDYRDKIIADGQTKHAYGEQLIPKYSDSWAMLKLLTSEQRVLKSVTLVPSEL